MAFLNHQDRTTQFDAAEFQLMIVVMTQHLGMY